MIWSTVFGSSVKISVEMELEEGPDWITFFILVLGSLVQILGTLLYFSFLQRSYM
jgi:hypothetical protein